MILKRNKICLLLMMMVFLLCSFSVQAKQESGHNHDLEEIMFNNHILNYDEKEALDSIEKAAELTIDQFKGAGKDNLEKLNERYGGNSSPLPKTINEIDFTAGSEHRKYTHRGWDFHYSYKPNSYSGSWNDTWIKRKEILLYTADSIFEFADEQSTGGTYSEKCNSFCALVYYIHLIGDHENDYTEVSSRRDVFEDKMGLGGLCDKVSLGDQDVHNTLNLDIIDEILTHSAVLFNNQKFSPKYLLYVGQLKSLDNSFKKIVDDNGHIIDYDKYYRNTKKLKSILQNNLYDLLEKETFFNTVFTVK